MRQLISRLRRNRKVFLAMVALNGLWVYTHKPISTWFWVPLFAAQAIVFLAVLRYGPE